MRLKEVIKKLGVDVSVESSGKSARTLNRYVSGEMEPPLSVITGLAERSGYSVSWLATGQGPMIAANADSTTIREPSNGVFVTETVDIPRLDIRASAGAGASAATGDIVEFMPFPLAWLKARGLNPAMMRIVDVAGDSMEPTLSNGDIILVDTSVKRIRGDMLYVIVRDDEIYVKRAQQRMNGSVLISSDNERYPPEEITPDAAPRLQVAGRVVWFGRSI